MLARFRKGKLNPDEQQVMEDWYAALDDPDADISRNPEEKEAVWDKIDERIASQKPLFPTEREPGFRVFYYVAAAVLLLVGGLLWFTTAANRPDDLPGIERAEAVVFTNHSGEPLPVDLADGSRILLEPGARLEHAADFNTSERNVFLQGNAFFEVARDETRPFEVRTEFITTKVLGTSFSIRQDEISGETAVEVISGKVAVNIIGKENDPSELTAHQVLLTANLKTSYLPAQNMLVTGLVDVPRAIQPPVEKELPVFNDIPLSELIKKLRDTYGIAFRVEDHRILDCPITADLSNEPLPIQLEMIVTALNARFSVDQNGVLITGGSCSRQPSVR